MWLNLLTKDILCTEVNLVLELIIYISTAIVRQFYDVKNAEISISIKFMKILKSKFPLRKIL